MNIRPNALILVADGEKYLLLRNHGTKAGLKLQVEGRAVQDNPPNRELADDAPGRRYDNGLGPMRSAMEPTDHQQIAEDRFAAVAAAALDAMATSTDTPQVVVVAPPRALAELRRQYTPAVTALLTDEVDKTLTGHPLDAIADLLAR
jgi:protein required for attachment to host cells